MLTPKCRAVKSPALGCLRAGNALLLLAQTGGFGLSPDGAIRTTDRFPGVRPFRAASGQPNGQGVF